MATKRIKFLCEHCGQTLSVGVSKVGSEIKCPKCKGAAEVPSEADAAASLPAQKKESRSPQASPDAPQESSDPFAAFAVYDEDVELIYEGHLAEPKAEADPVDFDRDKVAVSRSVIYTQGALLAVATLIAFTFGVVIGSATSAPDATEVPEVCTIKGTVTIEGEGANPGALVVIVPADAKAGTNKANLTNLNSPPEDSSDGENGGEELADPSQPIRVLGGDVTQANQDGSYAVQVPEPGTYFMLFLYSGNEKSKNEISPEELAKLRNYFSDFEALLESRKYSWLKREIEADEVFDHELK